MARLNIPCEVTAQALREIEAALARYEAAVNTAPMQPSTKKTYIVHATNTKR